MMGSHKNSGLEWMNLPDGRTVLVLPEETSIQTVERIMILIKKFNCCLEFGERSMPRIVPEIPIDQEQASALSIEVGSILQLPVEGMGIFAN